MNVRLLRKIQRVILRSPNEFDMETFDCGTAACIAGHGRRLVGRTSDDDYGGSDASGRLFWAGSWPKKYEHAYRNAKTSQGRARAAVRRIDHFIKTKGAE